MKKAILTMVAVLAIQNLAQAKIVCNVMEKQSDGTYVSNSALTKTAEPTGSTIIYKDDQQFFALTVSDESLTLGLFEGATMQGLAYANSKKFKTQGDYLSLIAPKFDKSVMCFQWDL